jgi:hypothetical protein
MFSLRLATIAIFLLLLARPLEAQTFEQSSSVLHVETTGHERWLHGRQQPRFTPYTPLTSWTHVASIATDSSPAIVVRLSLDRGRWPGRVTYVNGAMREVQFENRPVPPEPDLPGLGSFAVSR